MTRGASPLGAPYRSALDPSAFGPGEATPPGPDPVPGECYEVRTHVLDGGGLFDQPGVVYHSNQFGLCGQIRTERWNDGPYATAYSYVFIFEYPPFPATVPVVPEQLGLTITGLSSGATYVLGDPAPVEECRLTVSGVESATYWSVARVLNTSLAGTPERPLNSDWWGYNPGALPSPAGGRTRHITIAGGAILGFIAGEQCTLT